MEIKNSVHFNEQRIKQQENKRPGSSNLKKFVNMTEMVIDEIHYKKNTKKC